MTTWEAIDQAKLLAFTDFDEIEFDEALRRFKRTSNDFQPPAHVQLRVPSPERSWGRDYEIDYDMEQFDDDPRELEPQVFPFAGEAVIHEALTELEQERPFNIMMFGYHDHALPRRDAHVARPTLQALYAAILESWRDWPGFEIVPYVVRPQPLRLLHQGLSFVILLQHQLRGAEVLAGNERLTLLELQTINGHRTDSLFQATPVPSPLNRQQLILAAHHFRKCLPNGPHRCNALGPYAPLHEAQHLEVRHGDLLGLLVEPPTWAFDPTTRFRSLDLFYSDFRDPTAFSPYARVLMHGYRFRPLRTQTMHADRTMSTHEVIHQIATLWTDQPIGRVQVFYVPSLTRLLADLSIEMHLIVAFDLRPGHAICLTPSSSGDYMAIAGPELLPPRIWRIDDLEQDMPPFFQGPIPIPQVYY